MATKADEQRRKADEQRREEVARLKKELKAFIPRLKTCPFCGAIPEIMPWQGGGPRKTAIGCENDGNCNALPSTIAETPEKAVERWNTRAP